MNKIAGNQKNFYYLKKSVKHNIEEVCINSVLTFTCVKLLCVTILFICALAATFSQWTLIGCFTLNQNYIAKEVCINKNNPASHCNGQCFLSKQLHTEDKPESPLNTFKSKFEIQLFFYTGSNNPHIILSAYPTRNLSFQPVISSGFLHAPFHPPSMV